MGESASLIFPTPSGRERSARGPSGEREMSRRFRCLTVATLMGLGLCLTVGAALGETAPAEPAPTAKGDIVVKVTNLQNLGKGQLLAHLYKKVKRVEVNGVKYFRRQILSVKSQKMTVTFKDVPHGEYAVAILHDMDSDLEMDTTLLGIPDEDLGVSNNVKGGPLGGPKWNKAKFKHQDVKSAIAPIEIWQCYD